MTIRLITGDCRTALTELAEKSVQTCVTSPPYFGLRDYGTAVWEGGDPACDHVGQQLRRGVNLAKSKASVRGGGKKAAAVEGIQYRGECKRCGARRLDRQIGLEETVDEYVASLVEVFRLVRRALKDDGTLWLNLGDSYASNGGQSGPQTGKPLIGRTRQRETVCRSPRGNFDGIKPKELMMIPARVAIALSADGWYLRSDIVWAKPNPMPESVRDRPTKSHEFVYLLSKSPRYYYDAAAIAEPAISAAEAKWAGTENGLHSGESHSGKSASTRRFKVPQGWETGPGAHAPFHRDGRRTGTTMSRALEDGEGITRNRRDVWTMATIPYNGAHFATMPPALAELCILAGSRPLDTVLDPFGGAGTTGLAADRWNRDAILIDLKAGHNDMAEDRLRAENSLLVNIER